MALCVSIIATATDSSVYIEESGRPNVLSFAIEDDPRVAQTVHGAWRFLRGRRADSVDLFDVRLEPAMPYDRRDEVVRGAIWLLRRILKHLGGT